MTYQEETINPSKRGKKFFEAYIDGSGGWLTNEGKWIPARWGFIITKEGLYLDADEPTKKDHFPPFFFDGGKDKDLTNNSAEYLGLKVLVDFLPSRSVCVVYSDSMLVVCQNGGEANGRPCFWECKNPHLARIRAQINDIKASKELTLFIKWIPREENRFGIIMDRGKKKHTEKNLK